MDILYTTRTTRNSEILVTSGYILERCEAYRREIDFEDIKDIRLLNYKSLREQIKSKLKIWVIITGLLTPLYFTGAFTAILASLTTLLSVGNIIHLTVFLLKYQDKMILYLTDKTTVIIDYKEELKNMVDLIKSRVSYLQQFK